MSQRVSRLRSLATAWRFLRWSPSIAGFPRSRRSRPKTSPSSSTRTARSPSVSGSTMPSREDCPRPTSCGFKPPRRKRSSEPATRPDRTAPRGGDSARGLQDRLLYLVLTKGVPLRIAGTTGLTGTLASVDSELTLLYRRLTGQQLSVSGRVDNPFFLGSRPIGDARRLRTASTTSTW